MSEQGKPAQPPDPGLCHAAFLYRGEDAFAAEVTAFVRTAQSAGEPVLVILPRQNLELAQSALEERNAHGPGTEEIRFEEMSERAGNPSCLLAIYQDWIDEHPGRVRVVGEAVWPGRSYAERVECLRHEALMNDELACAEASILCPYDADRLDSVTLVGAELTHPQLVDQDGVRRASADYEDPLELARGLRWPQTEAVPPVHEHPFAGDLFSLRQAVASDPITGALGSQRRDDLVFVVNEAATNAVKHGDGTCTTRLWNDGAGVVSEVTTDSVLADAFAGRRRPDQRASGGRGLWLINQICDLVELRSGDAGTVLRMHVRESTA